METELSECPPGDVLYDPTAELPSCDDDIRKDQFILPPVGGFVEVRTTFIIQSFTRPCKISRNQSQIWYKLRSLYLELEQRETVLERLVLVVCRNCPQTRRVWSRRPRSMRWR